MKIEDVIHLGGDRAYISAGNDRLYIPLYINTRGLADAEISNALDIMSDKLGAQYFRDKELLLSVLSDQTADAQKPLTHMPGPYLMLFFNQAGTLRISMAQQVAPGGTVYAYDQFVTLTSAI